jgi:EAL domain-containing protein (putative c-di-GMP-specific phosphodiesterase class I)
MQAKRTESAADEEALLDEAHRDFVGWQQPKQRLREALAKNELQLYAQPILALARNRFAMAEILVRLREEEAKLLPPGDFLPTFEHYRMMPELDRWVVSRTVQRLGQRSQGALGRFNINVASQTLGRTDVPGFVLEDLLHAGVRPDALCFEIDESDVLARPVVSAGFAAAVRSLGCRVAVDGFGYRATSFAPLKTMQVDFIKVDGSITRNVLRSERALNKLQTIVRVGKLIKAGVIAECVEQKDVLEKLRGLGVDYAQGFGIARPVLIDELPTGP